MPVETKDWIQRVKKHWMYLWLISDILVICINIVIIYSLIKLICIRFNEIIPLFRMFFGNFG
jgi:hypothetical protein